MVFFQECYVFGLATLDVAIRQLLTKRPAQFPESKDQAGTTMLPCVMIRSQKSIQVFKSERYRESEEGREGGREGSRQGDNRDEEG